MSAKRSRDEQNTECVIASASKTDTSNLKHQRTSRSFSNEWIHMVDKDCFKRYRTFIDFKFPNWVLKLLANIGGFNRSAYFGKYNLLLSQDKLYSLVELLKGISINTLKCIGFSVYKLWCKDKIVTHDMFIRWLITVTPKEIENNIAYNDNRNKLPLLGLIYKKSCYYCGGIRYSFHCCKQISSDEKLSMSKLVNYKKFLSNCENGKCSHGDSTSSDTLPSLSQTPTMPPPISSQTPTMSPPISSAPIRPTYLPYPSYYDLPHIFPHGTYMMPPTYPIQLQPYYYPPAIGPYHEPIGPYHEPIGPYHEPIGPYHEPIGPYHEPIGPSSSDYDYNRHNSQVHSGPISEPNSEPISELISKPITIQVHNKFKQNHIVSKTVESINEVTETSVSKQLTDSELDQISSFLAEISKELEK